VPFMNRTSFPVILTAILFLTFLWAQLAEYDWDVTRLIVAGDYFVRGKEVPGSIHVLCNSYGYDGQFYYRLALDPFTDKQTAKGIKIDSPPYRHQRILYPLLVWLLSFGYPPLVPYIMLSINYAGLCYMAWIGGLCAERGGKSAMWGAVFPLYCGFLFTLSRDLVEILEISLLLTAFLLIKKRRGAWATLFFILAVLAKETALIVPWAAFLALVLRRSKDDDVGIRWHTFSLPAAAFLLWRVFLYFNWGTVASYDFSNNIGIPFLGFLRLLKTNAPFTAGYNFVCFIELVFIVLFTAAVLFSLRGSTASALAKLSWCHYLLLVYSLTNSVWVVDEAFFRALSEFFVIGYMILLGSKLKLRIPALAAGVPLAVYLAVLVIYYPDLPRATTVAKEEMTTDRGEMPMTEGKIRLSLRADPSKSTYRAGEKVILRLDAEVPPKGVIADIYLVLLHPDGKSLYFAPAWKRKPTPLIKGLTLPPALRMTGAPLLELTVPAKTPPSKTKRTYTFAIGTTKPGTLHFISNIALLRINIAP